MVRDILDNATGLAAEGLGLGLVALLFLELRQIGEDRPQAPPRALLLGFGAGFGE